MKIQKLNFDEFWSMLNILAKLTEAHICKEDLAIWIYITNGLVLNSVRYNVSLCY